MAFKYAILLDGGFVTKKLQRTLGHFPTASDVDQECQRIASHPKLANRELLRIYFYDASPAKDCLTNPIDGSKRDLATTPEFGRQVSLLDKLELTPNFAVRLGEVAVHGWKLGDSAFKAMVKAPRPPTAHDIVPDLEQKGVDLRIGLDIARLSLRAMVDTIVVVTGDSDLVPAFKFARREGVRIFLDHMGHGVRRELKAHADVVL
ncbi:MAG: NYN domain-containing protein [Verrucomicrobiota bacterium]|jgi:uncharacterized LabA/DUF88 family protein